MPPSVPPSVPVVRVTEDDSQYRGGTEDPFCDASPRHSPYRQLNRSTRDCFLPGVPPEVRLTYSIVGLRTGMPSTISLSSDPGTTSLPWPGAMCSTSSPSRWMFSHRFIV